MIELLNPKPLEVARFAGDVLRFRTRYGLLRARNQDAAREFAVDRFCTPNGRRGAITLEGLVEDLRRVARSQPDRTQLDRLRELLASAELEWHAVNQETIRVYRWAPEHRRARAILVHGWEGYGLSLGAFVPTLVARGFEVVAFDHRAHGESTGERSGLPNFVWDLEALVDRLGPFDLALGHSLGGAAVLQTLARRSLRATRAVVLAPFGDMPRLAAGWSRLNGLGRSFGPALIDGLTARYGYDPNELAVESVARRLDAEVHIVHDRADPIVPPQTSEALASAAGRVTLELTEGWGHTGILTAPEALTVVERVAGRRGAAA